MSKQNAEIALSLLAEARTETLLLRALVYAVLAVGDELSVVVNEMEAHRR